MSLEFLTNLKKQEIKKEPKSQEELRGILENKLKSMKFPIQEEINNYRKYLNKLACSLVFELF